MAIRICHYTSFETLKLIIKNKTIRFNSLKNVDDYEEGYTYDFGHQSSYFFASCWTHNTKEKIPLWKMYAPQRFSIKIEIDSDFMNIEMNDKYQVINHSNHDVICYPMFRSGGKPEFFSPVDYRPDPKVAMCRDFRGMISEDYIYYFGTIKRDDWDFQDESRFILQASPKRYANRRPFVSQFINHLESIDNNDPTNIEYIDMPYDFEKMKTANFMLGPSTDSNDRKEFEDYIKNNVAGFVGEISRSKVMIRHR